MHKVIDVNGTKFEGYLVTNQYTVKWDYDKKENCCEIFGVNMPTEDLTTWIGKEITQTKIIFECINNSTSNYDDEGAEWMLKLSDDIWLVFYNFHNGYYTHNLDILITQGDKELHKWNVAI
jgi:hypothetical protein